jgi:hypothetical protein
MRGPGTNDECVQFPDDLDLGPVFLSPDDLIEPDALPGPLTFVTTDTISDLDILHYTLHKSELGEWRDLQMDLWIEPSIGTALRHTLQAAGPDPLFGAGEGLLSSQFTTHEIGPQPIEPIAGCEIDLPLPPNATRLVRLPGLIAFDTIEATADIAAFYEATLVETGWEPVSEPQLSAEAILLSYRRGGETLEINLERDDKGTYVEMLLDDRQESR